eukprot:gene9776-6729_t
MLPPENMLHVVRVTATQDEGTMGDGKGPSTEIHNSIAKLPTSCLNQG